MGLISGKKRVPKVMVFPAMVTETSARTLWSKLPSLYTDAVPEQISIDSKSIFTQEG